MLTAAFDVDTSLEKVADGRWRGSVPKHWFIATGGPNGGFLAALVARVAGTESGHPPRSLTVHYLAPPVDGAIELVATIARAGRSTTFMNVAVEQDGRAVALALAVCAAWRDDAIAFDDTTAPAVPRPEDCERIEPERTQIAEFLSNYEMRFVPADRDRRPVTIAGWIRTPDARPSDHALLAAMSDALMPPVFMRLSEPVLVPTLELTLHFLAPPPEGDHPWVLGRFSSRLGAGGTVEESGELFGEDGGLLVQARQLAVLRRL